MIPTTFNCGYGVHPSHVNRDIKESIPCAFGEGDIIFQDTVPSVYYRIYKGFTCERSRQEEYQHDPLEQDITKIPFNSYYGVIDFDIKTGTTGEDFSSRIHCVEVNSKIVKCTDDHVDEYDPVKWKLHCAANDDRDPEKDIFLKEKEDDKKKFQESLNKMTKKSREITLPNGKKVKYNFYE